MENGSNTCTDPPVNSVVKVGASSDVDSGIECDCDTCLLGFDDTQLDGIAKPKPKVSPVSYWSIQHLNSSKRHSISDELFTS